MIGKILNLGKTVGWFLPHTLSVSICGFILCTFASGLDENRTIAQFHHSSWTAKDGAPGQIRALAQTSDGYLWLGTSTGLYRFDGVLFERYIPLSGESFPSNNVYSLLALSDGGLWIGYRYGGVSFLKDGNLTDYGGAEGLPPGTITGFARDDEGTIWAGSSGGLTRLEGRRWQRIATEWNFPGEKAQAVFVDKAGTLWVASEETIVFLPKGARSFQSTGERVLQVLQMAQSRDGTMWMAETSRSVRPIQLSRINPPVGLELRVGSVGFLFDRKDALWVTSLGDGMRRVPLIDRFRRQTISQFSNDAEIFTEKNGLSADYSSSIIEDREGNIWIGSANGLDRFRETNLVPIQFPAGYQDFGLAAGNADEILTGSSNQGANLIRGNTPIHTVPEQGISFVYRDAEGTIWMGGTVNIFRLRGDDYSMIKPPPGLKILGISTIFKDRNGVLWIYFDQAGIFQLKNGDWERYDRQSALPKSSPITGSIDSMDRKWFGYAGNILTVIDGDNIRTFSRDDGLAVGDIKAIQEQNGRIWVVGTLGVAVLEGDWFRMLIAEGSAGFSGVSGIVKADDGGLWLNESRGIVNIPAAEIRLALENPAYAVHYRLFDFLDGLPGATQQNRPFPTAIKGSDGRLWFSTNNGVVWIDPANITANSAPPPVSIRSLIANEESYESPSPQLPRGVTSLRINYTALSLSIPERVRFRHRLAGVDKEWQEAGTRREAFYTNLGPGFYHFQVIAANNDGVWNETGATLEFTIQPAFYQTLWFRLASLLLALLFVGVILRLLYNRRISQATEQLNTRFEERLMERNRISQELHDTLLQGFLGITMRLQAISNILPAKPESAKENLDNVLDQVDLVLEEGRRGIWDIKSSTITENDLTQAFTLIGEELNAIYPANFSLTIEGENCPLHPLIRDEVYRIGREALRNAFRHSKADKIEVEIFYAPKYLRIIIRDNGCGINSDILSSGRQGHLGLSGMRGFAEKIGAELKISSRAESGTEVELVVPHQVAFEQKFSAGFQKRLSHLFRRKAGGQIERKNKGK